MSEGIRQELGLFLLALAWGSGLRLLYDLIRLFRRLLPHSAPAVAAEDLLYWLACGVLIFCMLYEENSGAIRGFALAAVILGMLLCLQIEKILQKFTKKFRNKLIFR